LVAGAFYLLTFVSIPTLALYAGVRDPNFIVGPGPDTGVFFGDMLELIVALAGIGTAVALFPVIKRQSEGRALGFVTSRVGGGSGSGARKPAELLPGGLATAQSRYLTMKAMCIPRR